MSRLFIVMALALGGCAHVEDWCATNPRTCGVVATTASLCTAVGVGLVVGHLHKSAVNPEPKYTPYIAAFHAADQTRKYLDAFNSTLEHKVKP